MYNYLREPLDAHTRCSAIAAYGRAGVNMNGQTSEPIYILDVLYRDISIYV